MRLVPRFFASVLLVVLIPAFHAAKAETFTLAPGDSIQSLLSTIDPAEQHHILLSPGIYLECLTLPQGNYTIRGIGLTPEDVILDGSDCPDESSVISSAGVGSASTILNEFYFPGPFVERLTIQGGTGSEPIGERLTYGGGVVLQNDANLSLLEVTLKDNTADRGAAVAVLGRGSFSCNSCKFLRNEASILAGGIYAEFESLQQGLASAFVINSLFQGNVGRQVGVFGVGQKATIDVYNSTIVQNEATSTNFASYGVGFVGSSAPGLSQLNLLSSIIWDNAGGTANFSRAQTGRLSLDGSLISGDGTSLSGNGRCLPPRFVDELGPDGVPASGDENFQLRAGSPAIDSGLLGPIDFLDPFSSDLAGNVRFTDAANYADRNFVYEPFSAVDAGAYEANAETIGAPLCEMSGEASVVDISDLLTYLDAFLASKPNAEFNGDCVIDITDLLDYLNCWHASS